MISDGQYYMYWPPLSQSEVLKFKGTLDTHENTLAGFSKRHEEDVSASPLAPCPDTQRVKYSPLSLAGVALQACTSLETLLTKAYGVVAEINPEKVPYVVDPAETPSIADGIFVVSAGGTEVNSWGNMVFVLEAKLSVNVRTRAPTVLSSAVSAHRALFRACHTGWQAEGQGARPPSFRQTAHWIRGGHSKGAVASQIQGRQGLGFADLLAQGDVGRRLHEGYRGHATI